MKKTIIYGLGDIFKSQIEFLKVEFDIIGFSDKKHKIEIENYIEPNKIPQYDYDYIYVTSNQYFDEIKEELIKIIGEDKSNRIIGKQDLFGDFRNGEVRNDWVINKLKKLPVGIKLVDAGAGEQRYAPYCNHLIYISQDFGKYKPKQGEVGIHSDKWDTSKIDIMCDIIDMPLDNNSVDAILCTEVLEHIKNPVLAIKEFARILKLGGHLILTAPFCSLTHMAPYYFSNGFSEFWYKEHLADYGFEITEITRNGNYFKYLCQEMMRVPDMAYRYAGVNLNDDEVSTISQSIKILSNISIKDNGSSETLCFGYMVEALKMR